MHPSVLLWAAALLSHTNLKGKRILEVGSRNVNGTVRPLAELDAAEYIGIDVQKGDGVDMVLNVYDLVATFGRGSFDVVMCTEVLEHVDDWRLAVNQMKLVLKEGGFILLSTRSPGFPYHEYPADYWRFTVEDMENVWRDWPKKSIVDDVPQNPGVMLYAFKPFEWEPISLEDVRPVSVNADTA